MLVIVMWWESSANKIHQALSMLLLILRVTQHFIHSFTKHS